LKAQPENRVIFIANCFAWKGGTLTDALEFLLEQVLFAFANDETICKRVENILEISDYAKLEDEVTSLILEELPQFCAENKLNLFAIFDQHNALTEDERQRFPFELPEFLPSMLPWIEAKTLVVISASANNEYYLKVASKGNWPQFILDEGFTHEEFGVWVKENKFFEGDENLPNVEYQTANNPNELHCILDLYEQSGRKCSLPELVEKYCRNRFKIYMAKQQVWSDKFCQGNLNETCATEVVMAMMLRVQTCLQTYNRELIYFKDGIPKAITPVARDALLQFYDPIFDQIFEETVKGIFRTSDFPVATKGLALQQYMTRTIGSSEALRLRARKIDVTKEAKDWAIGIELDLKRVSVREFSGNYPAIIDRPKTTIFVPTNPNYPDVDLLIWDAPNNTLYPIQITLIESLKAHTNQFFKLSSDTSFSFPKIPSFA
jgi:hypothetical protein